MNGSVAVADDVGGGAATPLPLRSTAEMIEILIYTLCLCVGGPLNVYSFRKMLLRLRPRCSSLGTSSPVQATSKISAQNLLRLNLNIADLCTMFIYTLSQIIWMVTYQWYAGDALCRVVKFFHTFGFYLNSFVVACFAIDRAMGTMKLNSLKSSTAALRRTRRMLTVAWVLAFVLSLPQSFIFRLVEVGRTGMLNFKQCAPIWTITIYEVDLKWGYLRETGQLTEEAQTALIEESGAVVRWERIYNIAHLLFVFWVPTLIIVTSYTIVICTLNSFVVVIHGNSIGATLRDTIRKMSTNPRRRRQSGNTPCGAITTRAVAGAEPTEQCHLTSRPPVDTEEHTSGHEGISMLEGALIQLADVECMRPVARSWEKPLARDDSEEAANSSSGSMHDKAVSPLGYGERANKKNVVGLMAMQTIKKARQKAKRQAALILLAYLTFWTPYNLLAIINAFSAKEGGLKEVASVTLPFLNSLIVMNPIVNPLIYEFFERE